MSPYDAYDKARKEYAHLPSRMQLRRDLIAGRALHWLGIHGKDASDLLTIYSDGKTRDRVVAAWQHHINRIMNKTRERQAMKYPACSTCKNEPYQAGAGGPCATCVMPEDSFAPTKWTTRVDTMALKQQAPIERALATMAKSDPMPDIIRFLDDLCHPDQYGHAVTKEVRIRARQLANALEETRT